MVAGEAHHSPHRDGAGDREDHHDPRRCGRSLAEDDHADEHRDERIDDGESRDDQVGRPRAVGGLHEVSADRCRRQEREHADRRDPFELAGLDALDHDLRERRDEAVEHAGADHVEEGAHAAAEDEPASAEDDDHDQKQREDHEELAIGHLLLCRIDRGEEHEQEDPADAARDRRDRLPRGRMTRDSGVEQGRDDERDGAQRLHDDQRRLDERRELADDGETEHQRADEPGGARQQSLDLIEAESGCPVGATEALHLLDTAVLVLRTERHEDGTRESERDAEQDARVLEGSDDLVADLFRHVHPDPCAHTTTLPADPRALGL